MNPTAIEGIVQVFLVVCFLYDVTCACTTHYLGQRTKIKQYFFTDLLSLQPALGPDGKKKEPESNVLLASIENMQYAVTVDVLHTVRTYLICLL